jgi:HD-GYP domain-containing protein (c-di-GMP phosphodiesterase class II)
VHTATAAFLAATRLGWQEDKARCVLRASLTMNIGMADLQNRLVNQVTPLTTLQRAEIAAHPERSAQLLEMAGVTDADWLDAVRQHHEQEGGGGYPKGLQKMCEVALLVQRADSFTAKFSARVSRAPVSSDRAARLQYQMGKGDPMTAALIKEFGLYPPGCAVRLKSGETGVVMRRGEGANTPMVAVLTDRCGDSLLTPARRDTSKAENAVVAVMPMSAMKVRIGLEKLIQCAGG